MRVREWGSPLLLATEPPLLRKRVERQGAGARPDGIGVGRTADQALLFNASAGRFAPFGISQHSKPVSLQ
jgi:hypothetical protein